MNIPASKPLLHWVLFHALAFFVSPFCFILAGILTALLFSAKGLVFGTDNPPAAGPLEAFNRVLLLLGPFLTGLLLGALVARVQIKAMRKSQLNFRTSRWLLPGMLGLALAAVAFAWTASSPVFLYPLLMADLLAACLYSLTCALPQAHMLRGQVEASWRWLLFGLLAALLAFPLAFAPTWLPDGPAFFWLAFPIAGLGGALYGLLTFPAKPVWG